MIDPVYEDAVQQLKEFNGMKLMSTTKASCNLMDINEAVIVWNSLQAALRVSPSTLVLTTLVLQTTVSCTLLAGATDAQGNRPWSSARAPAPMWTRPCGSTRPPPSPRGRTSARRPAW